MELTLDDLIVRRQQQLADLERRLTTPTGEAIEFGAYLCTDLSVEIPVSAILAETPEDLAAVRTRVERCPAHAD